jgi:hypothetical protein
MSSSQQYEDSTAPIPPTILIEEVEEDQPRGLEDTSLDRQTEEVQAPESSRLQVPVTPRRSNRKRTVRQFLEDQVEYKGTTPVEEPDSDNMSSQPSKHKSDSSSKRHHGSSNKKERKSSKSDDWSEVTEPEERRRIQNRIAQRKFRKTSGYALPRRYTC